MPAMRHPCLLPLVALAVAGCGNKITSPSDAGPAKEEPPPPICLTPNPTHAQPWFSEITAEVGLGTAELPKALATSVYAGDLDGDGYADALGSLIPATRETDKLRYHFLLMNRPDPNDAKKRIFVDTTKESGLTRTRDGKGGRGYTVAFLGDLDNDGDLDVITCPGAADVLDPCGALLNDGTAHFELAPLSQLELDGAYQVDSGTLFDLDRDGILDFWPGTFGSRPSLYKGGGDGRFTDIADQAGLPSQSGPSAKHQSFRATFGVTACDLDSDGDQDVILADYGREANQVWLNDGGKFTEHGIELGVAFDDRMDCSDDESYRCWCELNAGKCKPGLPASKLTCPPGANQRVWVPGQSDQPYRQGGNTFGIACGDVDNDGDMDLMTAEIVHWDVGTCSDPSELLLNDSPPGGPLKKFRRPGEAALGMARAKPPGWNRGDMMPEFPDVDLDGLKDIYLTTSDYPDSANHGWLWRQKADHTFEDISVASGAGQKQIHGVAWVDIDNDGDLDMLAGTTTARGVAKNNALRVYRNDIGQDGNWSQVLLHGLGAGHANRSAVGARVSITAGGVTQIREVQGGHSHEAVQNGYVLTFGLGASCAIDELSVRWPDAAATVQTWKDVRANYRLELTEGTDGIKYNK